MEIAIYSDIHLEFHDDDIARDRRFLSILSRLPKTLDVLVLAGDLDYAHRIPHALKLASAFARHVIFVAGNHEFYSATNPLTVIEQIKERLHGCNNIHVLNNDIAVIDGIRFLGSTLWFAPDPFDAVDKMYFNDFRAIKGFEGVYAEWNRLAVDFFSSNLQEGDIAVSHHAPHPLCINPRFHEDRLNRFYYTDMDHVIQDKKPAFWLHGHMHDPVHLKMEEGTWIESNPVGYPMERQLLKPKVLVYGRE